MGNVQNCMYKMLISAELSKYKKSIVDIKQIYYP